MTMSGFWSRRGARFVPVVVLALAAIGAAACRQQAPITTLERLAEARRLSAAMAVQFTMAADAGNRAVMADTDEASTAFAREARSETEAVERDRASLEPLLRDLGYTEEVGMLAGFTSRFAEYRALDANILDLAVENTNLKAQRLSFGPVQEAADAFRDVLRSIVADAAPGETWRVRALAAEALAEIRQIQVLQAPHIAESDDAAMTKLEERAAASEKAAREALKELAGRVRPGAKPRLAQAADALDHLSALNTQIVGLSRRNSNVRSLALALGQKRTLTAACEESLRTLQDALARRGFSATK